MTDSAEDKADTPPEWTVRDLILFAQTFDKIAQRSEIRVTYSTNRKLSFTARKYARTKLRNDPDPSPSHDTSDFPFAMRNT